MFGKIKKDKINQNNNSVERDLGSPPPVPEVEFKDKALSAVGTGLSLLGIAAGVLALVGGAVLALKFIVGMMGLSMMITLLILSALAGLCCYAGPKLMIPQAIGV